MAINSRLLGGLTRAAFILFNQIKSNLRSGKYPKEIEKGIEVGNAKVSGQGGSIAITFSAPMSRAFELGSGEKGPEGKKYEIHPDEAGALAFDWDKMPKGPGKKFIGQIPSPDDRLMFRFVEHPGIEARPYIRPALEAKKEEMKKIIGQEFVAYLGEGRKKRVVIK